MCLSFRNGPRFPSFVEPYDKQLIAQIHASSKALGIDSIMKSGTYVMQAGPCFETPAEIRFLHAVSCKLMQNINGG